MLAHVRTLQASSFPLPFILFRIAAMPPKNMPGAAAAKRYPPLDEAGSGYTYEGRGQTTVVWYKGTRVTGISATKWPGADECDSIARAAMGAMCRGLHQHFQ